MAFEAVRNAMMISVAARRLRYAELHRFPQKRNEPQRKPGIVWHARWCGCMPGGHRIGWRDDPVKWLRVRR